MRPSTLALPLLLIGLLVGEATLASYLPLSKNSGDIAAPPSFLAAKLSSLGEDAFFFRSHTLALQHAGNLDGEIVPYYQMDYPHLKDWLTLLDRFDGEAEITPMIAARLYGNSQNGADTKYVIDYLEARALAHPLSDWRWLGQAVYLARFRLKDQARAQTLAHELGSMPISLPSWARDLEIFVMVDRGDKQGAKRLLAALTSDSDSANERQWAAYYRTHVLDAAP
jgi:hypothetical protein